MKKKKQLDGKVFPATRREFLSLSATGTGLVSMGAWVPGFLTDTVHAQGKAAADKDGKVLVVIKLAGGNDGLNTVVPFNDDTYYQLRPSVGIPKDQTLVVDDQFGFNPVANAFEALYKDGNLAVIHDVGYPNSTHSHFSGQDFYERAGGLEFSGTGWLGRYLDAEHEGITGEGQYESVATHISRYLPITLRSKKPQPIFSMLSSDIKRLMQRANRDDAPAKLIKEIVSTGYDETNQKIKYLNMAYMNAIITEEKVRQVISDYKPDAEYPQTRLSNDMRAVAAMIAAGMGNRIYSLDIGGFDVHSNHLERHNDLIEEFSGAIGAFINDLEGKGLDKKAIVLTFSEFGRRPYENGAKGTDHGTNSTFFLAGTPVKGGMFGKHPVIPGDGRSDVPFTKDSIDFRQIYATVLEHWLETDADQVLAGKYDRLELFG